MQDLNRFIVAQKDYFKTALQEIKSGKKKSHWMWYIFPQIIGLGESYMSTYYAITDKQEANDYLENEYLKNNLEEICAELLKLNTNNPQEIFGSIDSMKLKSSMTLFKEVSENKEIFEKVLEKFFSKEEDEITLEILKTKEKSKHL